MLETQIKDTDEDTQQTTASIDSSGNLVLDGPEGEVVFLFGLNDDVNQFCNWLLRERKRWSKND